MKDFSIVIPAHNEEDNLERTVNRVLNHCSELIIVEDGSSDQTPEIAEALSEKEEKVRFIQHQKRLGKGKAVRIGLEKSNHDIRVFMDADLSTDPKYISEIVEAVEEGADLAIGSRYLEDSEANRNKKRSVPSRVYNFAASRTLDTGIRDHQCGFKAIKAESFEDIKSEIESEGWFWDTELIYRMNKRGMKIKEIPVQWETKDGSALNLKSAVIEFSKGLYRLNREKRPNLYKYVKFATVGGLGALLNTAVLFTLTEFFGIFYIYSSAIAIESAIIFMFLVNNRFTFHNTKKKAINIIKGLLKSNIVRSVGIGINLGLLYFLTELGLFYLVSNIIAIFIASIANFYGEKKFNWKE